MAGKSSQSNNRGADLFGYFVSGKFKEFHTNQFADSSPLAPSGGITASGGIVNEYTSGPATYRAHIFTTTGEFDVTQLGGLGNTIDYLVVGGGGGGGTSGGGGGGAGLLRYIEDQPVAVGPYTVTIGAGGAGAKGPQERGVQGGTTTLALPSSVTCPGGGGGGGVSGFDAGGAGGAGGGGAGGSGAGGTGAGDSNHPGGVNVASPPNGWGGDGGTSNGVEEAGGGGGAGGNGETRPSPYASPYTAGTGGLGARYTIAASGTVGVTGVGAPGPGSPGYNWFAGGGGARSNGTGGGGGGTSVGNSWSGGGSGSNGGRTNGSDGTPGSGGGGGGAGNSEPAFNGGAGVVVVRYKIADTEANTAKASGGSISFYNDGGTVRALHVFTGTQPFQVTNGPVTCSFFIVAGGGGGGFDAAGGGGGGGVVYHPGLTVADGNYTVTIGAGGAGATNQPTKGSTGIDSRIQFPTNYQARGGGGGGSRSNSAGEDGGSGGGGGRLNGAGSSPIFPVANPGASEHGSAGGTAGVAGAGGGGATTAGQPYPSTSEPGWGGAGMQAPSVFRNPEVRFGSNIPGGDPSGADWAFAGGGGGGGPANNNGSYGGSYVPGSPGRVPGGPYYGAGSGALDPPAPTEVSTAGKTNTGGGGGGGNNGPGAVGSPGGSGIVLITYPIS